MRYQLKVIQGELAVVDSDPWDEADYPEGVMCIATNPEAAELVVKALNEYEYGS